VSSRSPVAHRVDARLDSDPGRVVSRLFLPGEEVHSGRSRAAVVVARVLALPEDEVERIAAQLLDEFSSRHRDYAAVLVEHAATVGAHLANSAPMSAARTLVMGASFTAEYAVEGAALCNPSAVLHPDQRDLPPRSVRVAVSLRGIGEGHHSSIAFASAVLSPGPCWTFEPRESPVVAGLSTGSHWQREHLRAVLLDRGAIDELTHSVLAGLPANDVKLSADLWSMSANADGILDFTVPAATIANVAIAAERGLVHIIGTTGLSGSDDAVIKSVTSRAIVVKSGNMSLGINLLAALVRRVAQSLDEGFDIEILEMHHRAKIDAPSGTALMLGQAAAEGRGIALDQHAARGRDGITGARRTGDIGFASLRGGSVTGDHSVIFAGPMERIELTHRAEDRTMFAQGAIKAALWARDKKPGMYSMADVLGLGDF